jgi:hypothetical protein
MDKEKINKDIQACKKAIGSINKSLERISSGTDTRWKDGGKSFERLFLRSKKQYEEKIKELEDKLSGKKKKVSSSAPKSKQRFEVEFTLDDED